MKKNVIAFAFVLLTLTISNNPLLAQNKVKYSKVENTIEICETMKLINNYLKENFSDEDYRLTGISTFGQYNCIAVMSGAFNQYIDLDTLLFNVYNIAKEQNINYENIRYILFANNTNDLFPAFGEAIAISGIDWQNNLNDFAALKAETVYLKDKEVYGEDEDLSKIIKSFRLSLANAKSYDNPVNTNTTLFWRDDRHKTYDKRENQCSKRIK